MDILKFLLALTLGFLLLGIWFGLSITSNLIIKKLKLYWLLPFNNLLSTLIPLILILMNLGIFKLQTSNIGLNLYLILIFTVAFTIFIVSFRENKNFKEGKELFMWGIDGMIMEVPQRMMMQSFVYGILNILNTNYIGFYTIISTSIIWCLGICMQTLLFKKSFDKEFLIDIFSSFVFSIGIGYIYHNIGSILLPMMAHFFERILSNYNVNKKSTEI